MKYSYYPGCSLERQAGAYHQSALAVAAPLEIELVELEDWNCCGAIEYIAVDLLPAYALISRNLALAAQQNGKGGNQLVAPCSACYLNLSKADKYMDESPELAAKVNTALEAGGLNYTPGTIRTRHLLDVIVNDIGFDKVKAHVSNALSGLRVAPYYGCVAVRPGFHNHFDDHEYPTSMDKLMQVMGAQVVDFPLKAHCCGGHMTQISQSVALELIRRLLKNANDYAADVIVTICPMCQLNLDAYQESVNRHFGTDYQIPILYFTQLMGLAFGLAPEELGIGKEFIDARPALTKIGQVGEAAAGRAKRDKKALPMPRMAGEV
jgi:heterodisulfide reductase subunit B